MAAPAVQRSSSPVFETAEPIAMTREEMESAVSSLSAEDIGAIGQTLLAQAMDLMGIDAPRTRLTGRVLCDQKGDMIGQEVVTEPHRETEARNQFALLGLPILEKQLAEAFSTPGTFVEKGIYLTFIGRDDKAIVSQMKKQSPGPFLRTLDAGSQRLLKGMTDLFRMECVGYGISLKLNTEISAKRRDLYFDVTDARGHRGYTLESFREAAVQ